MSALDLGALVLLGLVGSTHCLSMCSAFVLCLGGRSRAASVAYQGGRLVAYALLGAVLGLCGAGLRLAWDQAAGRTILVVGGILVILLGLVQSGFLSLPLAGPTGARAGLVRLLKGQSPWAPLGLGVFTGLLPCPLLYAALLRSAVTASPFDGAGGMLAFWLGTLPAMAGVSFLAPWLGRHGRRWWPRLAFFVTAVMGGLMLYHGLAPGEPTCPNCAM